MKNETFLTFSCRDRVFKVLRSGFALIRPAIIKIGVRYHKLAHCCYQT